MLTKFLLPPPKEEIEVKPIDIYSDEEDLSKDEVVSVEPIWNEISPLWHFTLGDEKYYIIFKKIPGAKYRFNLENNDTKIHIIAEYTPIDEEVNLLSQILKLNASFITSHFIHKTMKTVIKPPQAIFNNPQLHSKSQEPFAFISYPIKKSFSLIIE